MFWFLLLPILILIPLLPEFIYLPGAAFNDLVISHYPNALYLYRALANWGQVPLWSESILSGYPFAADPLSGLWYPPGWLAVALPAPLGFNLTLLLHIFWGGLGAYLFLRADGKGRLAAVIGALTFEAMPKLFGHLAAGHVTLVYAVAWAPWVLWAERRQAPAGGPRRLSLLPAVMLALTALADVRWALPVGLLWVAYALHLRWPMLRGTARQRWTDARYLLIQVLLALLLAAPLLFPLAEYTRLTTRAGLTPAEAAVYSLPPARLLGLLFPDPGGNAEFILYPGGMALALAVLALASRRVKGRWFWGGVLLVALLYSLGSNLPGFALLARLPGLDLLRVPPRALFLAGLAFAVLSASGAQALLEERPDLRLRARWDAGVFLAGLAGLVLMLAAGIRIVTGELPFNIWFGAAMLGLGCIWTLLRKADRLAAPLFAGGAILLTLANLGIVDRLSLVGREPAAVFAEGEPAASYLASQPGVFRVYSPSYSLPQQTAALYGLELADGVDPMQLASYADFMRVASGIPADGYSVTLPPFASGDPATDNAGYLPDAQRLGQLNVRYVVSGFDLVEDGLALRVQLGETRIYENQAVMPRAWLQDASGTVAPASAVVLLRQTPNDSEYLVDGGGLFVLSEIAYPGWRAQVDGREADLRTYAGILRAVELPPGKHRVSFTYRPASVALGLAFGAAAWLAVLGNDLLERRSGWKKTKRAG